VLYVGKAASLRQRVSGHFHAGAGQGERALEMLTQVQDVSWSETESALEAALLEADEIKRLLPPFNVALAATGRAIGFATADLEDLRERPDAQHRVGPLPSRVPFEALTALRAVVRAHAPGPASLAERSRALGVEPAYGPGPECFAAGLARFAQEHGPMAGTRDVLRLGARLWARRLAAAVTAPGERVGTTRLLRPPAGPAGTRNGSPGDSRRRSSGPPTQRGAGAGSSG